MGDFTCFCLYFEVNAFKRLAESLVTPPLKWDFQKKYNHHIQIFVKMTLVLRGYK